ncbi:hypothetical protein SERLADRAFT_357113 [Serpula lacrymans var. lacrymans S7.9]|uniref:Velvet domain-containing protein n=1 Tax=Serpula lacrymans var. lacrymans (strain S7.9) TaxID=578457 RepID=F8P3M3_SERL9|nr:uncharacterized protein SERLADRAFT_357113 [Serpula lacrymans var. lacrymans S7.9]EGO22122.1 hypothetical protein SERLADRAFT_357113 [Serpula lacrymans var. lacrymans S7.9]
MPGRSIESNYWSKQPSREKVFSRNVSPFDPSISRDEPSLPSPTAHHTCLHRIIHPIKQVSHKNCTSRVLSDTPCICDGAQRASPAATSTSDQSSTQSPPTPWSLPSQTSPSNGRSTPWNQAGSDGRATPSPILYPPTQSRPQHSSFLNDNQTKSYYLDVVQHPQRTAEFGSASLSRLPLAPPIVVQLIVRDRFGNSIIPEMELPFLIAHLSLFTDDGRPLDVGSSPTGEVPPRRLLYGNLVASPQKLRDLQGRLGLYFLFSDVSIRWRGRFQLGIALLRISETDPSGAMSIAEHGTVLAQARTRPFDVLAHENYVAPSQTRLTQCFLRQGARIHAFTPNMS